MSLKDVKTRFVFDRRIAEERAQEEAEWKLGLSLGGRP